MWSRGTHQPTCDFTLALSTLQFQALALPSGTGYRHVRFQEGKNKRERPSRHKLFNSDIRQQASLLQQVNSHSQKTCAKSVTISVFNDSKHTEEGRHGYGNAYICKAPGNREVGLPRPPYIKIWAASSSRF